MRDVGIPCPGSSTYRSCNQVQYSCCWWYTYSPGKPQGRWLTGDEPWLLLSDTLSMVAVLNGTFYDFFPFFLKKKIFFTTTPLWIICALKKTTLTLCKWYEIFFEHLFTTFSSHNMPGEGFLKPTATFPQIMHYKHQCMLQPCIIQIICMVSSPTML